MDTTVKKRSHLPANHTFGIPYIQILPVLLSCLLNFQFSFNLPLYVCIRWRFYTRVHRYQFQYPRVSRVLKCVDDGYPTGISSNTHGYRRSYKISTTGIPRIFIFRPPSNHVPGYWIPKKSCWWVLMIHNFLLWRTHGYGIPVGQKFLRSLRV